MMTIIIIINKMLHSGLGSEKEKEEGAEVPLSLPKSDPNIQKTSH
jgi:hypothetical protein